MVYMTYWFLCFAFVSVALYWIFPPGRLRSVWLLFSCVLFHGHFAGPAGVLPILFMGVITYLAGKSSRPNLILWAMVMNVAGLFYYKYTHFFLEQIMPIVPHSVREGVFDWLKNSRISAPLAISFFTFEFVHYLYDVKKGSKPIRSIYDFCLFAIFWPSIVAGPVKRYQLFLPELRRSLKSKLHGKEFTYGFYRITSGVLKKVLADNITAYIAFSDSQEAFAGLPLWERWLVIGMIALRIYFDFSGYSDLAVGYGRLLNVKLPENFNWPYLSSNLADFWRRWHISLSSWIRDYIYIPLGGSRGTRSRKVLNGLLAFFICGLWHGAAWNFAVWGLYHGLGLAISGIYRGLPLGQFIGAAFDRFPLMAWALNLLFVCVGWIFFFYPMSQALDMLGLLMRRSL